MHVKPAVLYSPGFSYFSKIVRLAYGFNATILGNTLFENLIDLIGAGDALLDRPDDERLAPALVAGREDLRI